VHFRVPHTPYDPGRETFDLFYDGPDDATHFYNSGLRSFDARVRQLVRRSEKRGEPLVPYRALGTRMHLTPSVLAQLGALYDGNIREGDRAFGALIADQRKRGLAARTLVVVAADHGESLGEHHIVGHNALYDGVLHTPLIVHVPGRRPEVVDRPTMNVDIVPTILAALGLDVPDRIRGIDVLGEAPRDDRAQFAEYSQGQAIVADGWKLLVWRQSRPRLYHVREDPEETRNIAGERPDRVQELFRGLQRIQAASLATERSGRDTDVLEKLRALGYIDEPEVSPPPDE
jgi:membrane-anchored protein YejM (alkaline phosphatase superfamily)